MLSNIFLHHVLDKWLEDVVRPRMRGRATLVRFADDFVMTFETHYDAKRVMDVLGKRLGRFGLKLHPDKTSFIDFRPQRHGGTPPDCASLRTGDTVLFAMRTTVTFTFAANARVAG
jgi:hypothetical protein